MNPVLQLYALCLEELPNYNEDVDYWIHVENDLKKKPLYQNDIKRKNRMENLKLQKVKELLFNEFIEKLSEPKVKKVRKTPIKKGKVEIGDNIDKTIKKKEKKAKVEIIENKNEIQEVETKAEIVPNATIKVTLKTKTKKIESIAYIFEGKNKIWKYTNEEGKTKDDEIIYIISQMIEFAKPKNMKLVIDINSVPFKKDYMRSLLDYKEIEKNVDENVVQKSIDENDVGRYKSIHNIFKYEKLIQQKEHFTIKQ